MQRFLSITLALFIGLSFSFDAEARRFGGGKSFGAAPKHRQVQPQQRQQQKQAQPQQNNTGKTAATSGASRWLGPLAGIAAGGLLEIHVVAPGGDLQTVVTEVAHHGCELLQGDVGPLARNQSDFACHNEYTPDENRDSLRHKVIAHGTERQH